ncbi:MAG TPA: hypothetical protein VEQ60_24650 [Longimicrobium sp.]|nr:hypothetical protein [Longimicrobium sp.]
MSHASDPADRRYADAETERILRRAAELQGTAEPPTSPTLTDLQQIADEAGIEPRYVRQAAAELAAASRGGGMAASSTSLGLERVVPGEVPATEFDALVEAIRAATGMAGQATVLGRGFTWTSGAPGHPRPPRAITLTVTAVDGETTLRATESLASVASDHLGAGVASALIGGFGAVAAAGGDPSLGVIAAAVAWAGGSLLAARGMQRRAADRHRAHLAELLDRVAERARALISAPRESSSTLAAVRPEDAGGG